MKDRYPPASFPLGVYALFQTPKQEAIVNIAHVYIRNGASLVAQMIKNLPAMWETWIRSLDQEDPLEKGMATHSSILACRIPWTEEPGSTPTAREAALWEPVRSLVPGQAGVLGGPQSPCHSSPSPCSACGFLKRVYIVIASFSCR